MSSDIKSIIKVFSTARMDIYLPLTPHGEDVERLKLAEWDDLICSVIWGEIRIMEIMLRNAIAARLSEKFKPKKWWEPANFKPPLKEMLEKASKKLKNQNKGTEGHFIAELPMGFWSGCLAPRFFREFWKDNLKNTFPHIKIQKKEKQRPMKAEKEALKQIHKKVEMIRHSLRNPIGHHHPMLDKQELIQEQLKALYEIMDDIEPLVRQKYCREEKLWRLLNNPPFPLKKEPTRSV